MDYNNKPDNYYKNIRHEMLDFLPSNAKKVLDIGCAEGFFGEAIKIKNNAEVWGIEYMEEHANVASNKLDKVYSGKCEDFLDKLPNNYFDVIYFNDVLEHLVDPEYVLKVIKQKLVPNGKVISSIPNLRYYKVFMEIYLEKDFKYKEEGVLDKTHLRFFTKKSIKRMYENLNFKVLSHIGINGEKPEKAYYFKFPHYIKYEEDMLHLQYATVAAKAD